MSGKVLEGRVLQRANPKTIQDKFLVGYQGWFTCPGDGEPLDPNHHGWLHWFDKPLPDGGRPNTDIWPDISDYSPSELYPATGLKNADGEQMFLFSSRHSKTVRRHFHWMALHGVDGAFLQRFAGQCDIEAGTAMREIRDEVGDRVREAAEAEGRVFAIMYDVSGVHPDKIQRVLEQDWMHLVRDKCILDSPNYLREKGSPVIALWGFGFNERNHSPDVVRSITNFFRSSTPGGAYLMAGVPGHWRTSTSDSDPNPEFLRVWTEEFDALSPWTIGRYGNEEDAERWGNEKVKPDFDFLKQRGDEGKKRVDYIPVVLPGGSGYNLSGGQWGLNDIKRNGGRFLWKQIYAARHAGVRIIYGAMWDEYDEGTAFMPVVSSSKQLPVHPQFNFLALDADGYSLPSDWYMRITGLAAESLRGDRMIHETFPVKELQDYWATRPRYEDKTAHEEEAERWKEAQRAYHDWATKEGGAAVDEAPPPYRLEDEQPTHSPRTSSTPNVRPVPPEATKPTLGHSSSVSASLVSPPPVPARSPSLTTSSPSAGSRPPVINMSSRPPPAPMSARPVYSSDKVDMDMRPQQLYQRPGSSHSIVRPSSQVSFPLPPLASSNVAYLADDLARQKVSHHPSEVVSTLQESHVSGISSSVMQMPSVEASLRRPSISPAIPPISPRPPASQVPVASWSQYPGQQQLHYGPYNHPPAPPLDFHPSPSPQGRPSAIGGPGYDRHDAKTHSHAASYPRVEQLYPNTIPNSGVPQEHYMATDKPPHPCQTYPASNPLAQDYFQHQVPPAQPPGGSHSPRPYPPPEWGIPSSPPSQVHHISPPTHPQSQNYCAPNQPAPMWTGNGGGGRSNLAGRALDTVEGIAGRDARRHLESLAQSGSKLLNKFK
ncbi:uncharacterized protein HD556DRAFT_1280610 [Suillus plorans]|uniref:Xylosidase/arabinosidase n=1 Tax=Suillus plorans TaxID=116603 RepID=A0A9P7E3A7_9AGAM|nr:uncharacterized protein HD556DRAFT_1280610 [Suillus plorans]KAG1809837.1 hypothetical protein HD556DRAFT_1280610 [Suillus plorans]